MTHSASEKLPKIALVMSEGLPVPAVRGGAVENLVQVLLDENEKTPAFAFTVFSVADAIAEERSRAYAHARFFFFPKGGKPLFRWVAKHLVPSAFYPGDPFIAAIAEKMRGEAFDAIVVENAPRYAISLRKLFPRTPILHHFHNRKLWRGCRYERKIAASSDAYVCVSDYIRRDVLTSRRVAPESVFRCHNGIDVAHFSAPLPQERRSALRAKYGLANADFVFVYSGRIVPEKGIGELLEAFSHVEKRVPCAKLLLLGANVVEQGTAEWRGAPASKNVVFTGLVPYAEMPDALKCGDVAVLPSIWDDPCPLALIEALAAGLPTILTDSGGMPEIAAEDAAVIVPRGKRLPARLAEAMEALAANPEERRRLAENAAARGALFSRERYWTRFREIVSGFIPTNRNPSAS